MYTSRPEYEKYFKFIAKDSKGIVWRCTNCGHLVRDRPVHWVTEILVPSQSDMT